MQDYTNLFTTLPLPLPVKNGVAQEDDTFAWMRVAGFNPLVIQKALTLEDTIGLSDAQLSAVLGAEDTVQEALTEGRLFLADYKALANVINGNFPDGPKYAFAPRALYSFITEPRVEIALHKFRSQLEAISATIQELNKTRYEPYPYLDPNQIPQSINI